MEIGRLRHPIVIEKFTVSVNSDGDDIKAWTPVARVRADVKPVRANEKISSGQTTVAIELIKFMVRADRRIYAFDGADVGTKIRIKHRELYYNVVGIAPMYNVRGLELTAERIV